MWWQVLRCDDCQENWHSNITKCPRCNEKWHTATSPFVAPATKSHTPTWLSIAPATKSDTPTWPNSAPAMQSHGRMCDTNHMKRHLQWRTSRPCVDHDSKMIRTWSDREIAKLSPARRMLHGEVQHFALQLSPIFTTCCACHEESQSNITKWCACPLRHHQMSRLLRKVILNLRQRLRLPWQITFQNHHASPATKSRSTMCDTIHSKPWNCKTDPVRSQSLFFPRSVTHFVWKIQHFVLRLYLPNFTTWCACTKRDSPTSPNAAPARRVAFQNH